MNQRQITRIALAVILFAGAWLRFAGVGSPIPYIDESLVVKPALALSWQDPNPHVFYYGSFPFYLFKFVSVVGSQVFGLVTGRELALPEYYILLRLVSMAFGVATVALCFLLGRILAGPLVGLIGAALVAFSPLAIALSHTATVDATVGFWCAVAWVSMALWITGNFRWAPYLAGIATGFAMGTKYNAALLLLPIGLLGLLLNRADFAPLRGQWRKWMFASIVVAALIGCISLFMARDYLFAAVTPWTSGGHVQATYVHFFNRVVAVAAAISVGGLVIAVSSLLEAQWACWTVDRVTSAAFLRPFCLVLITFLAVAPFIVLNPRTSLPDVIYQVNKTMIGRRAALTEAERLNLEATQGPARADRLYYLRALKNEWGPAIAGFMLIGFWALRRVRREAFVAYGVAVITVLAMSLGWRYDAARYLYPFWPVFALLSALGIAYLVQTVGGFIAPRLFPGTSPNFPEKGSA